MTKILFVCLGNICRSPTAEGVFRARAKSRGMLSGLHIDSAGTIATHEGEAPDPRSQAAAKKRGVDLSALRARRVRDSDFAQFDHILAMDQQNLEDLKDRAQGDTQKKIRLFLPIARGLPTDEVPDPYYGGASGFEDVLDLIEAASDALLDELRSEAD